MSTKTVKIDTAGAADLIRFAKESLGITFKDNTPVVAMRAKVKAAHEGDEFTLEENQADEAPPVRVMKSEVDSKDGEAMVTVMIAAHDGPGGDEPVPVSVNGKAMLIPRGVEAPIKRMYLEVLKNAVEARYEALDNGGMSPARPVHRYPFSVLG
jgi:hypothetical protein